MSNLKNLEQSVKITSMLKKNQVIEIEITDLAYGGEGVGRHDGYVVFVPWTVPGDIVQARIIKRKKSYGRAILESITTPSELRIQAPCPHFTLCGGCRWQNLVYSDQLKYKSEIIKEHLELSSIEILPSPQQLNYRNKMEFTFGEYDGNLLLGLHKAGDFSTIINLEECFLQSAIANQVYSKIKNFINDFRQSNHGESTDSVGSASPLTIHNKKTHKGILRYLILRTTQNQVLVNLVTNTDVETSEADNSYLQTHFFPKLVDQLSSLPQVTGITWSTSSSLSDAVKVDTETLIWGQPTIQEMVGEISYEIGNKTFFQTNSSATTSLYNIIREFVLQCNHDDDPKSITILDLYCGTGSIGLYVSDLAKEVIGIEIVPEAIAQARQNAEQNNIQNCTFYEGDVKDLLKQPSKDDPKSAVNISSSKIDILILDPPRSGMTKKALKRLLLLNTQYMIYVSCNPTTLARDLEKIKEVGYDIQEVRAVDMFPQTFHVETVVLLNKI